MFKKDLGIVICNFNKIDYLKGCLETLYKSTFKNLSYDVIIVDNASTDGSSEYVKENYLDVILLQNEINTGGSGGFDRGIRFAIEKEYKYVALLDNDILLEENTIINLIEYIKNNPQVGVVGSKICTMDNPDILQEMGSFIDFEDKFNVYTPLKSYKDDNTLPDVVVCDYVPACCLITRSEVLKKVGSFNVEHFIYWDDMDWCIRVKLAGWEIHAINSSRVFHKMGATNHTNTFGMYYFERNRILFFLKYIEDNSLERFSLAICDWLIQLTFFSNLKGNYGTPKSFFCAIDDLLIGNLGKQDSSIYVKNVELDIFNKYKSNKTDNVCIYLNKDMISNRKVYLYLKNYYQIVKIYCDREDYENIKLNFNEEIISIDDLSNCKFNIFLVQEHILNFNENNIYDDRYIFIDQFMNTATFKEIKQLKTSYIMYENIFRNIYQPLLIKKIELIRNKFKNSKVVF